MALTFGWPPFEAERMEVGLKRKARSHLHRLQKRPERIKRYFKHPNITYAAAAAG